ncbi:MAG TPA: hypothetical protein VN426_16245 [Syntrophomonadaceae bacterium]|nr:hypothetical protein [Syntrophomonadaceae bacterium]
MLKRIGILIIILTMLCPGALQAAQDDPLAQGFIEGYLNKVTTPDPKAAGDYGSLSIETYGGAIYDFAVTQDSTFSIDNTPVKLQDLHKGMEVYGKLEGSSILTLEGYSTAKTGYIQPGSRVVVGTIQKIDSDQLQVQQDNGMGASYYTTPATPISRSGQAINLDGLYVGDRVKLYFDEIDNNTVSRIEVQGASILVKDVYKGSLSMVDTAGLHCTLSGVQVLKDCLWQSYQPTWRVDYNSDLPVFMAGQKISLYNLKYYKGRDVYLVTKSVMGKECIDRMVIKSQYEAAYSAQINDINWGSNACKLNNNKNVSFNDGSIIIQDGRLQDKGVLSVGTDAYFVTDSLGSQRLASLVYIFNVGVNNSSVGQSSVYSGRLSDIFEDSFWLRSEYQLQDNSWQSCDKQEVYYDNDTSIFDMVSGKVITPAEFVGGDYTVDSDSDRAEENDLNDWYAYVYTMGDRAACIGVYKDKDTLSEERISTGTVRSLKKDDTAGWEATLQNSCDWSGVNDQWMPKNADLTLGIGQALIIRNNKIITAQSLKSGDRLYIVRNDFYAKVVLVK